jgi:hypothetical protein
MSLSKFIIIVIGLSFLVIPFNIAYAQFKIHSSEGTEVIGDSKAFESSNGENWTRHYAPGQQEKEYQIEQRRALETEKQQKAAEEKAADRYYKNKELEVRKKEAEARLEHEMNELARQIRWGTPGKAR